VAAAAALLAAVTAEAVAAVELIRPFPQPLRSIFQRPQTRSQSEQAEQEPQTKRQSPDMRAK